MRVRRVASGNHEAEGSKDTVQQTQLHVGCTGSVIVAGTATGAVTHVNVSSRDCAAAAGQDRAVQTLDDRALASDDVARSMNL
jgi:hypothetical protein